MFPEASASAEKYQELSGDPSRGFQALGAIHAEMGEGRKRAATSHNSSRFRKAAMSPGST